MYPYALILLFLVNLFKIGSPHGMVLDPVNRGSRWRYDISAPADYDDNQAFCGGFYNQWIIHDGKCGICGDDYDSPTPRSHEYGGFYGNGTIVREYPSNGIISVGVLLTANHKGYFVFDLCNLDYNEETDECFNQYRLNQTTGESRYVVTSFKRGWFNATLALPEHLSCEHCVLRWTYNTGNSWGPCSNGSYAVGCGPQENFRSCSDIAISPYGLDINEIPDDISEYADVD